MLRRLLLGFGLLLLAVVGVPAQTRDGGIDPRNLGKGEWLYYMSSATNKLGGNVAAVTNETSLMLYLKSQGIRYVIVKAATSDQLFKGSYSFPQFHSNLVKVAHACGLLIFGYNRSYGANIPAEIAIANYVFNQGADGFVFDAEAEWESTQTWIGTNGPALAWQLCSAVRSNWPTKFLAHAPFPIISYHSSFPYKEFGYWCDTVMPQIYHFSAPGIKGSMSAAIEWSDVNWDNWQRSLYSLPPTNINGLTVWWTNAIKPLAPINDVYGPLYANPTRDKDVQEFIDYLAADPNCVTPGGYQGVSFFRADLHGAAQWAYIKGGSSGAFGQGVDNLVIDNPRATVSGAWTSVRTFYNGSFYGDGSGTDTNSFGTNYLAKARGSGTAYVLFRPTILVPGDYQVYEWHPQRTNASASVPFLINSCCGTTTVYANQQTNTGNWCALGRFSFDAGTDGSIRVSDAIPEPNGVALADGLKLVFVPPATVPALASNVLATANSTTQITLTWVDAATNETGYVVYRAPTAAGGYVPVGRLGRNATRFDDANLTPGTPYFYRVFATNYLGFNTNPATVSATTFSPKPPHFAVGPLVAGAWVRLELLGDPAHYSIEGSTNLATWQELTNVSLTLTNATFEFIEPVTNWPQRFYRARVTQ